MNLGLAATLSREITKSNVITELSDDMKDYFKNKNYGSDIKEVAIGIICVSQGFDQFFKIKKPRYTKDKKNIKSEGFEYEIEKCFEYSIKLDFEKFQNSSEEECKKIVAKEILLSLDSLDSIKKKIKDFDWDQFKKDLENFFKEKNLIWINKTEQLENVKKEITFESEGFYPGLADEQNKTVLINLFNNIIDEFISGVENNFNDKDYVNLISKNVIRFDTYNLDTEDREYICSSFEKIMDAVDLGSSDGILNKWMYEFDIS